jgi:hypothetical protein
MDEFFVCSGNTGTNKKLSALQTIDWPKAGRFIENRHLPILDKDIRILCDLRVSSESRLRRDERVVSILV